MVFWLLLIGELSFLAAIYVLGADLRHRHAAVDVPLGLMAGPTLLLDNGDGLDLFLGACNMVENPDNAPEWQIRWGISYLWN